MRDSPRALRARPCCGARERARRQVLCLDCFSPQFWHVRRRGGPFLRVGREEFSAAANGRDPRLRRRTEVLPDGTLRLVTAAPDDPAWEDPAWGGSQDAAAAGGSSIVCDLGGGGGGGGGSGGALASARSLGGPDDQNSREEGHDRFSDSDGVDTGRIGDGVSAGGGYGGGGDGGAGGRVAAGACAEAAPQLPASVLGALGQAAPPPRLGQARTLAAMP